MEWLFDSLSTFHLQDIDEYHKYCTTDLTDDQDDDAADPLYQPSRNSGSESDDEYVLCLCNDFDSSAWF